MKFSDNSLPIVVCLTSTKWDEFPRIRHQITRQLKRFCNVLYIEFFPFKKTSSDSISYFEKIDDRLWILRINSHINVDIRLYNNITFLHKFLNKYYASLIKKKLFSFDLNPSSIFNFLYNFSEIFEIYDESFKVYVCYDEWPKMWRRSSQPPFLKFKYQSWITSIYENETILMSNLTLVSHTPLEVKVSALNKKSSLFLHGHESTIPKIINIKKHKLIKVGFMGYITYNLIEKWLLKVLSRDDLELNLIGPVNTKYFNVDNFNSFKNFNLIGPAKSRKLVSLLQSMDVLIMPYDFMIPEVNVQTVSNKFFQYVASCRPVVISNMPHYIDMPEGVIYRASTAEEFVEQIYFAASEDCKEYQKTRAEIALKNTWDARGDYLKMLFKENNII